MKRKTRSFIGAALIFCLLFLFLPGTIEASAPSRLNVQVDLVSLAKSQAGSITSLEKKVYEEVYRQLQAQLGKLFSQRVLEDITQQVVAALKPQLDKGQTGEPPMLPPKIADPPPSKPSPQYPPLPSEPVPPEQTPSFSLNRDEARMLELVNSERNGMGLPSLQVHEGLTELARLKAQDMVDKGYFSHQSPTYGSPFQMMAAAKIRYLYAGENLAGSQAVDRAHSALMQSPGHRANILNTNFTHVGIGVADGGPYGKIFVQMFIKPL